MSANWSFFLLLIVIAYALWSILRRRYPVRPNLEKVIGLLNDISYNLKLIDKQTDDPKPNRKFRAYNRKRKKDSLEFLDQELARKIDLTLISIADYNSRIDSSKKKGEAYFLSQKDFNELQASLTEIKAALVEWLKED